MTDKPGVYDFAAINQYAKQHEAEKMQRIMGKPLEDPQPTEAPADIDWGMYAPCGLVPGVNVGVGETVTLDTEHNGSFVIEWDGIKWTKSSQNPFGLKFLAHPVMALHGHPACLERVCEGMISDRQIPTAQFRA